MTNRRLLTTSVFLGFFIGYFILSPFAMVVWDYAHRQLPIRHLEKTSDSPFLSVKENFTPKMLPWALIHASFGALIGGFVGFLMLQSLNARERELGEHLKAEKTALHAEALEEANRRLRELDKLKSDFLSSVSHELRTPLTSIKSSSEILLKQERNRKTQLEFLTVIQEESQRLAALVNDLLDLSKIESKKMEWHWGRIDLQEVMHTSAQVVEPLRIKKKITLALPLAETLPQIYSDRERLVQVFINLLDNAIKFTESGGRIEVSARGLSPPEEGILFSVKDTGIGIASQDLEKIFDKFYQIRHMDFGKPKGTGLGLAICKEIVERHEGKIWAESKEGAGSTFFFSLPLKPKEVG